MSVVLKFFKATPFLSSIIFLIRLCMVDKDRREDFMKKVCVTFPSKHYFFAFTESKFHASKFLIIDMLFQLKY